MKVHILVTVRNPKLLNAALLVFKTIRTGFPDAEIHVWGNALGDGLVKEAVQVVTASGYVKGIFNDITKMTVHDKWIEYLIDNSNEPFWIVDTDVVFWDKMDVELRCGDGSRAIHTKAFAGRYEPTWMCPYTKMTHVERLHTCCMMINPAVLRNEMRKVMKNNTIGPFNPQHEFVHQHVVQIGTNKLFFDSMAGIFHFSPNSAFLFDAIDNANFDHLHCGTYSDMVNGTESLRGISQMHEAVFADINAAKGLYHKQQEYYKQHAV